jgi:TubC N-terminal docking domain
MTAAEILAELQAAAIAVRVDGDNLLCRPRAAVPAVLVDEVARHKPEIIALILEAPPTACPACHRMDYMPLGSHWRRCWICGRRWGPAGSLDPGDPAEVNLVAAIVRSRAQLHVKAPADQGARDAGDADAGRCGDAQFHRPTSSFEYERDAGDAGDDEIPSFSRSGPQPYPAGVLCGQDGCRGIGWTWDADRDRWRCNACSAPLPAIQGAGSVGGTRSASASGAQVESVPLEEPLNRENGGSDDQAARG